MIKTTWICASLSFSFLFFSACTAKDQLAGANKISANSEQPISVPVSTSGKNAFGLKNGTVGCGHVKVSDQAYSILCHAYALGAAKKNPNARGNLMIEGGELVLADEFEPGVKIEWSLLNVRQVKGQFDCSTYDGGLGYRCGVALREDSTAESIHVPIGAVVAFKDEETLEKVQVDLKDPKDEAKTDLVERAAAKGVEVTAGIPSLDDSGAAAQAAAQAAAAAAKASVDAQAAIDAAAAQAASDAAAAQAALAAQAAAEAAAAQAAADARAAADAAQAQAAAEAAAAKAAADAAAAKAAADAAAAKAAADAAAATQPAPLAVVDQPLESPYYVKWTWSYKTSFFKTVSKTYWYHSGKATKAEALAACVKRGGYLVRISSSDEDDYFTSKKLEFWIDGKKNGSKWYFSDSKNTSLSFFNWSDDKGSKSCIFKMGKTRETTFDLFGWEIKSDAYGLWYTRDCDTERAAFVCEMP